MMMTLTTIMVMKRMMVMARIMMTLTMIMRIMMMEFAKGLTATKLLLKTIIDQWRFD